ncbi:MAG TPA: radical SAM protein [Thermoanaerobaculia bacterium]|nr:radical SAM protein [Thermoanaerobaculia bacterium]
MSPQFKASYYTRAVADGPWTLLYNGVTSGLMRLPQDLSGEVAPFLGPARDSAAGRGLAEWDPPRFEEDQLPPSLREVFPEFLRGRFFVPAEEDELTFLRRRNEFTRKNDPLLITLTTTLDCNFDCYYCYEDKSPVYLSRERCDQILAYIERQVEKKGHAKLYTDWYGGEPMLNPDAIEYFSARAIAYCERQGIGYSSAMISNGTHWPEDARAFALRNRLNHVQITLDGPARHHNTRRGFKPGHEEEMSSFDTVVRTIDRLVGSTRIYLRINVDPGVGRSALELVDVFLEHGWLAPGARVYPYLAPIGPMTEHCGFIGGSEKFQSFQTDFDEIKREFQHEVSRYMDPRGIEHLQIYPSTRRMNCAAVGDNSVVFGPDGLMYKCGLDVGIAERAYDALPSPPSPPVPETVPPPAPAALRGGSPFVILKEEPAFGSKAHPYHTYDPFTHERCSQCQYLPVCMGGCPKTWFEGNEFYLARRSAYWEENFEDMIRTYAESATTRA